MGVYIMYIIPQLVHIKQYSVYSNAKECTYWFVGDKCIAYKIGNWERVDKGKLTELEFNKDYNTAMAQHMYNKYA